MPLKSYFMPKYHLPENVLRWVEEIKRGETTHVWSGEYIAQLVADELGSRIYVMRIVAEERLDDVGINDV